MHDHRSVVLLSLKWRVMQACTSCTDTVESAHTRCLLLGFLVTCIIRSRRVVMASAKQPSPHKDICAILLWVATTTCATSIYLYMVVSLNYCSQNGGNLYRAPYYNGNPNIGPRMIGNLDQYPYGPACDYLRPSSIPCLCLDQSKQPCGANVIENAVQQHEAGAL